MTACVVLQCLMMWSPIIAMPPLVDFRVFLHPAKSVSTHTSMYLVWSCSAYLDTSLETVRLARRTMSEVSDLINSGFSQQGVETIEEILNLLHSAEHDNDLKQVALRKALFDIEHELNPVNAIFQYNVIDLIADIADQAQTAGNRMMYLVTS